MKTTAANLSEESRIASEAVRDTWDGALFEQAEQLLSFDGTDTYDGEELEKSARAIIQQAYYFAAALVRDHVDSDSISQEKLERAFVGVFERKPDEDDHHAGLWSHLCAAVSAE